MTVTAVPRTQLDDVVTVLCDAFHDYPVMRFVLGNTMRDYERRLRTLIGLFVDARFLREEPVLGIHHAGSLVAAALITPPVRLPEPEELSALRERTWQALGPAERARYDAFGEAASRFEFASPHYHLNMIGVRRAYAGQGLGRRLLDAVHQLSDDDPTSAGVTLSTEAAENVPQTWVFVRNRR